MGRHPLLPMGLQGSLEPLPTRTALNMFCPASLCCGCRDARSGTAPPVGTVPCQVRLTRAAPGSSCGPGPGPQPNPDPDLHPQPFPDPDPARSPNPDLDPGPGSGPDPASSPDPDLDPSPGPQIPIAVLRFRCPGPGVPTPPHLRDQSAPLPRPSHAPSAS